MTFEEFWARVESVPKVDEMTVRERVRYRELFRIVWDMSAASKAAGIATGLLRRSVELRTRDCPDRASVLEDLAQELRPAVKP